MQMELQGMEFVGKKGCEEQGVGVVKLEEGG